MSSSPRQGTELALKTRMYDDDHTTIQEQQPDRRNHKFSHQPNVLIMDNSQVFRSKYLQRLSRPEVSAEEQRM